MNRPFDLIHDPTWSYGRLIVPWFGRSKYGERRWLGLFRGKTVPGFGLLRTDVHGFHNCRMFGR